MLIIGIGVTGWGLYEWYERYQNAKYRYQVNDAIYKMENDKKCSSFDTREVCKWARQEKIKLAGRQVQDGADMLIDTMCRGLGSAGKHAIK